MILSFNFILHRGRGSRIGQNCNFVRPSQKNYNFFFPILNLVYFLKLPYSLPNYLATQKCTSQVTDTLWVGPGYFTFKSLGRVVTLPKNVVIPVTDSFPIFFAQIIFHRCQEVYLLCVQYICSGKFHKFHDFVNPSYESHTFCPSHTLHQKLYGT